MIDVARVRAQYPALDDGWAYLDGAAGTQVPRSVIDAVAGAWTRGIGNHGGAFAASERSDSHTTAARTAVADLVGAPGREGVLLGPTMTAMTYRVAAALASAWQPGDEVVLTRLDHDANVRPWVQAATRVGAVVRFVDPVLPSLDLPAERFAGAIGPRTRLVALTAASNVVGTRPEVREVCSRTSTGCTRPRTDRSTWLPSVPTSTPRPPTSGRARTWEPSRPTRPCWAPCTPTSSPRHRPRSRGVSSSARTRSPSTPGWPPRSTTSLPSTRVTAVVMSKPAAAHGCWRR